MRALGFDVKKELVRKMLADIGKDPHSNINFEEFCELMSSKMVSIGVFSLTFASMYLRLINIVVRRF